MASVAEAFQLANRLHGSGDRAAAEKICRQIAAAQPDFVPAWILLGRIASEGGDHQAAAEHFTRASGLDPKSAAVFNALGAAWQQLGQREQAIAAYLRALERKPDFAEAHYNYALVLKDCGQLDEAIASLRRAVELKPEFAETHYSLGHAYQLQGDWDAAAKCYQQALEASPNSPALWNRIGLACLQQGQHEEAIARLRQAVFLSPILAEAHTNLAAALRCAGHREEALACCRRALELKPDLAEAHLNLASLLLLGGDFENGWREFEWHWRTPRFQGKPLAGPRWNGEPLEGKTILLRSDQGLGDTIQFVRYALLVRKLDAKVIVSCQDRLLPLLADLPVDQVVGESASPPAFDFQTPLLRLPRIFNTMLDTIPANVPYLFAAPQLVEHWRERLRPIDGFKIGIVWQGNPHYDEDRGRSLRLRYFQPLASVPGVRLISLQKGLGTEQLAKVGGDFEVVDFQDELDASGPFLDTAAIMKNLDLVITSDTAAAHLAGALGVPIWVALRKYPNWRWLLNRPDSPWYPTMRLFRQQAPGDWTSVFAKMAAALRERWAAHVPYQ